MSRRSARMRPLTAVAVLFALAATLPAAAAWKVAPKAKIAPDAKVVPEAKIVPAPDAEPAPWLRVVEADDVVALEVVSRQFVREAGGPRVGLVGVAHIGRAAFYRDLQKHLRGYDVVLYESVLPPGANGADGEDDEQRARSTRAAMKFVASLLQTHHQKRRAYPHSLEDLQAFLQRRDARLARWSARASVDAWGHPVEYRFEPTGSDDAPGPGRYELVSLGADGAPGGEGADADITIGSSDRVAAVPLSGDENLQVQLASALDMDFQLDAMDYDKPNWRCSDLAMDQIESELAERGLEFGSFSDTLSGTSLPAKLVGGLLKLIRLLDIFLGGAIADACTLVLIETLGDEEILEQSMSQMGEGFEEVIVGERNQKVIDDLAELIDAEPDVDSVGIFYGAAHMADFETRLAEMGYVRSTEHDDDWYRAMQVDLASSAMSERELRQVREMVRQALQQQR